MNWVKEKAYYGTFFHVYGITILMTLMVVYHLLREVTSSFLDSEIVVKNVNKTRAHARTHIHSLTQAEHKKSVPSAINVLGKEQAATSQVTMLRIAI